MDKQKLYTVTQTCWDHDPVTDVYVVRSDHHQSKEEVISFLDLSEEEEFDIMIEEILERRIVQLPPLKGK
jgi:hypothetical protein